MIDSAIQQFSPLVLDAFITDRAMGKTHLLASTAVDFLKVHQGRTVLFVEPSFLIVEQSAIPALTTAFENATFVRGVNYEYARLRHRFMMASGSIIELASMDRNQEQRTAQFAGMRPDLILVDNADMVFLGDILALRKRLNPNRPEDGGIRLSATDSL